MKHVRVGNTHIFAEQQLIACVPEGEPGWEPEPGFILTGCTCGKRMWIGPESRRMRANGIEARCIPCAIEMQRAEDPHLTGSIITNLTTRRTRTVREALNEHLRGAP